VIALAWRNLWRQPRRTILTLLAIAFACLVMVFLLALQVGTYASIKESSLGLFDGYAQIQKPGYLRDPNLRKSFSHTDEMARSLEAVAGISTVAARAQSYALLSKDSHSLAAMIVGVQPMAERRVSRITAMLRSGRYLRSPDAAEIVLGDALARNLGVSVGSRVTMLGMGRDGSVAADVLKVVGVFSSGIKDIDRQLAEMPLRRMQTDFAMLGEVNLLVLSGDSLAAANAALPAIRHRLKPKGLVVLDWQQLEPGLKGAIGLDARTSLLWYAALVIVAVAILLNTIFMSVLERTREFGVLLALGMRPAIAGRMVWLEIVMLLAMGLTLGIGLGAATGGWFAVHGLNLPGAQGVFARWGMSGLMYTKLTVFSLFTGPAVIAVFTALAGVFPFLHVSRLKPVAAMRAP